MDQIKAFSDRDVFARHCGVEILEIGEGTAKGRLVLKPHHLNGVGIAHGAAIFTLADTVFAAASNTHGYVAVAVNVNIAFIKATESGTLYAQAKENNPRGRIGSYTVTISDDKGETVALFEGLAYRKF
jgi:acyl-CoA thioesterase